MSCRDKILYMTIISLTVTFRRPKTNATFPHFYEIAKKPSSVRQGVAANSEFHKVRML